MKYERIERATFLERPNRFIAYARIAGKQETIHVKNTGRCAELLVPEAEIFVQESDNPERKTKWDLIGVRKGNRLINMDSQIPNKVVEEWIQQYVPFEAFVRIRNMMQKALETSYATSYMGFLGVDMMVCRQKEGHPYAINPHVEINLRMNMGIVSHVLSDHFIVPGGEGRFSIDCFPTHEALMERHEQDMQSYPLVVKDGRVVSGYLPLVDRKAHV